MFFVSKERASMSHAAKDLRCGEVKCSIYEGNILSAFFAPRASNVKKAAGDFRGRGGYRLPSSMHQQSQILGSTDFIIVI